MKCVASKVTSEANNMICVAGPKTTCSTGSAIEVTNDDQSSENNGTYMYNHNVYSLVSWFLVCSCAS